MSGIWVAVVTEQPLDGSAPETVVEIRSFDAVTVPETRRAMQFKQDNSAILLGTQVQRRCTVTATEDTLPHPQCVDSYNAGGVTCEQCEEFLADQAEGSFCKRCEEPLSEDSGDRGDLCRNCENDDLLPDGYRDEDGRLHTRIGAYEG